MSSSPTAANAAAAAATSAPQETKGQDIRAVDFYQKGLELAHNANGFDEQTKAIESLSIAIAIRANQPRFFLARGNCFRAISEYENAVKDFTCAIHLDPRCPVYYANRGACYRKLNCSIEALEDLTAAIEIDAKKGTHFFNRGMVLYDAGFYREAILDFTSAIDDGTGGTRIEYRALTTRGNCYRKIGNSTKCIEDLHTAIKLEPRNTTGYFALGQMFLETSDLDGAIQQYTNAIAINDANATYFSHRGVCYFRKGLSCARLCLMDFNNAIRLDGREPQAYFYRGSTRLALALEQMSNTTAPKTPEEAAGPTQQVAPPPPKPATPVAPVDAQSTNQSDTARTSDNEDGDSSSGRTAAAASNQPPVPSSRVMSIDEQLEAAFADIEMAWTLCPDLTKYQVGMAMINQLLQRNEGAIVVFTKIVDNEPTSLFAKYHLALSLHMHKQYEQAIELLSDIIATLPSEPLFLEARALALHENGIYAHAIEDYTKALELRPDRAEVLLLRSQCLMRLQQYQQAVDDCTRAAALGLQDVGLFNTRGMAYRGLGVYDLALADLTLSLSKEPTNDILHFHRGLCFMELEKYADATPDFKAALHKNYGDPRILYLIGVCSLQENKSSEALTFFHDSLENSPERELLSDLHYQIGLAFAREHKNIKAIEHFTEAVNTVLPSNRAAVAQYVHERAKALQLEHYYDEAIEDFSLVLAMNASNAHAYFRRGFCYKALGKLHQAAQDFETAKLLDPTNPKLVVNYRDVHETECIILCPPGQEKNL